eukprot:3850634-Rhodomonas_salina.2
MPGPKPLLNRSSRDMPIVRDAHRAAASRRIGAGSVIHPTALKKGNRCGVASLMPIMHCDDPCHGHDVDPCLD